MNRVGENNKMEHIILEHVSKVIKNVEVLNDINLSFEKGKVYGLKGYNGSGKTMLLRMIAGLIQPTEGTVSVDGEILHKDIDFPKDMGVLIENPNFWNNYTAKEVLYSLAIINKKIGIQQIDKALARVDLDPYDKRTIRKYSLGMKKRLGIAQAIMEEPQVLLLDEPSNALDKKGVAMVRTIIQEEKERGALIVLASHQQEDLEICDIIIEIEDGRIVGYEK